MQAFEGRQEAGVAGFVPVFARWRRGDFHAGEGFGQKRVGQQPGRAGQGAAQVELTDEDQEGQAEDAVGAAAGFQDWAFELPQGVGGAGLRECVQQLLPETGMSEAAEVAGDGICPAVVRRESVPGRAGGGDVEEGFHTLPVLRQAAALGCAGEEAGKEGGPLEVGKGQAGRHIHTSLATYRLTSLNRQVFPKELS
ncbi:hypothetical protein HMPREF9946_00655 [Acetobacteraceae bacterium AT-5844]|nr:hypothetical protein HMPREF9946_00655 [Acetobacteraceae bacterium AT-5844]